MDKNSSSAPHRRPNTGLFYFFFFLSGVTALIYETAFARQLGLIFGSTLTGVSVVLAVFFGGLALGALLLGPRADRYSPLRLYGFLEIGIGIWAIIAVLLIPGIRGLYAGLTSNLQLSLGGRTLIQSILSALVLLPTTILMGATLPALSRGLTKTLGHRFKDIGMLYGINTIGATTGTLLCGFLLLENLGYLKTIMAAMVANFVIGVAALMLASGKGQAPVEIKSQPEESKGGIESQTSSNKTTNLQLVILFMATISGFAALGYEVVWFRTLIFTVVTDTYAFSLMLGTYLLGIGGGSIIAARRFRRPRRSSQDSDTWFELGILEITIALLVVIGFTILIWLNVQLPRPPTSDPTFWAKTLRNTTLQALALILPTTLVLGYAFPLMVSLYTTNMKKMGRQVGRVTAFNTFGGIIGSLAAGFILIPLAGIQTSLLILAGFSASIGLVAFFFGPIGQRKRAIAIAVAVPTLLITALLFPMRPHFGFQQIPTHERAKLLFYRESADQTVMVTEDTGDRSIRRLLINQQQATSTYLPGQRKNHLMGHLPLWACSDARKALVICFGSGGTFGALGLYDLDRVDCVEICSAVIDAASYFKEWNGDVLSRKHVRIIVDDGRSYLLTTKEEYDIITLEPMHPGLKGVSALYSVEFYQEAKNKLKPKGVLCQWIPLYSMTGQDARALLATAVKVFPQSSLWIVGSEGIILCARDSLHIDWKWLMRQVSDPMINKTLKKVYLDNPWTLLSGYLLGPEGLKQYTKDVSPVRDDHPFIEYSIPRHQHIFPWDDILLLAANRESPLHIVKGLTASETGVLHKTWMARKDSWTARDRGFAAISRGNYAAARDYLEDAYAGNPEDRYAAYFLKEIYWRYGVRLSRRRQWAEAVRFYTRAASLDPDDPQARFYLGVALYNAGRVSDALSEIRRALQLQPDFEEALNFLQRFEKPQ